MNITKINPIDENLVFERFIHPNQKQLPHIDIDIPKGYRHTIGFVPQKGIEENQLLKKEIKTNRIIQIVGLTIILAILIYIATK